jgi:hypothetical protein
MRTPSLRRREQQSTHVAVSDIISDNLGLHTVNRREQVAGVDAGDEQVCFTLPPMLVGRSSVVRGKRRAWQRKLGKGRVVCE